MGKVTALMMDVITEKSGHTIVPNAVSVCITPAAPSPVPLPYPVVGNVVEGITDPPMRTKVEGQKFATTGSVIKTCHGNEPGTLKETCSLNTGGPCFIIMGAPIVICELGMMGITGALCISNKAVTVGAGGSASGAGGAGGPGGSAGGGGAGGAGPNGPSGPSNGGGGGGGSNSGASASAASPGARGSGQGAAPGASSGPPGQHQCQNGHPVDMATGLVVDEGVDLEIAGFIPFVFKRFYSSGRNKDVRATLGPGWAHNWEMSVWEEDKVTVLRDGEGRSIFFERLAVGEGTFHRGERMELKRLTERRWEIFHVETRYTYRFEAFDPGGQAALVQVRDAWNNSIELGYDEGRLYVIVDTAGREIHVSWEGARIRRLDVVVAGSSEQSVEYLYSEAGCLIAVADTLGQAETFEYDAQHRMIATTIRTGVTFRYEYEADTGRCSRTWGPKGLYDLVFSADVANHKTYADGEEPRVYTVDDQGHVTREALPNGVVLVERAYDQDGLLIAEVNGAGEGTKYWHDARGNLVRRVDPDGGVTAWDVDETDRPRRRTTPDGLVTEYAHDSRGALTRVTFPTGVTCALAYGSRGELQRVDDQNGVLRSYEHDAAGNIHAEVDALGARTVYSYDALGRAVAKVDALGRTSRTVRDRLGRITAIIAPDGSTTTRAYDGRGNVVREVDPAGRAIAMEYYGMGTISRLTTADGRTWRFTYTANERVRTIQNPKGESHEIVYDEAGRIVEERSFDGRKVGQTRNAAGRVERLVYPDGSHRTFEYDRCGRMIGDVGSDGAALTFQRDKRGRIVRAAAADRTGTMTTVFERDAFGRITSERQGERVISYAYDPWGRVTERRLPTGQVTKYSYSREHDLVAVEHAGHRFDLGHDAVGRATHVTSTEGGFSLQYVHDAVDRLVEERIASSRSSSLSKVLRQTTYDRAGRPTRIVEDGWGESRIKHDPEGRLAEVLRGAHRDVFRYDAANELVGRLEAAAALPQGWTTGPGGQLLKTPSRKYAYDKRGRRTGVRELAAPDGQEPITEYVWDARDRLRAASLPDGRRVEYTYDAFGRRLKKEVRDASGTLQRAVEYVWSGNALAAELRPEGARAFVNRPASLRPLLHEEGGEVFLYVTDHVGTPRELIDKTGAVAWRAVYDAWGQRIEEQHDPVRARANKTVSSPFRRLGQVHDDETGLAWTRFRVFDAATGRWLSPDPLGVWGGMSPTGFTANPLADIDPFGLAHTPDQSALNSMARDAERRPTRGQPPLTHDEAQTMIDWADETGMPVRASASDTGASGPSHWTPDGRTPTPHVHVAGHHVPVQPGFVPRGGFR